jgi:hypothetical protein
MLVMSRQSGEYARRNIKNQRENPPAAREKRAREDMPSRAETPYVNLATQLAAVRSI